MRIFGVLLFTAAVAAAQPYDIVLKGGHVIDPADGVDAVMDVAVSGSRVAAVRADIPAAEARKTVDVRGLYVLPGLIDLHAHVFGYSGALLPDDTSLPAGTTTIVDAGGSGWRTFDKFRAGVIAHSRTRVLALINIVGAGMVGPEAESNTADMDSAKTSEAILKNHGVIVGVKTAHFGGTGWTAIDRAREAGRLGKVPIMVDDHIFTNSGRTTREKLLDHLRPGDIHTHMYNDRQIELVDRFSGKVQPYMLQARERGVKFDMGHGAGSFLWPVAAKAMAQGFVPDTISTDLHSSSIMGAQPDMPNCISKMMLLGMKLADAVLRSTVNPAKEIGRYPEIGTLGVGRGADIAVLDLRKGVFAFKDAWGVKRLGTERLENVLTIRDGSVVYDRDGRSFGAAVSARAAEPQEIYDILIKNGRVIDPANHRDGRMDVAVIAGRIARVGENLPAAHARVTIEAGSYYVTPGLIDLNPGAGDLAADHNTLANGVTAAMGSARGRRERTRMLEAPANVRAVEELRFKTMGAEIRKGALPETISTAVDARSTPLPRMNLMETLSKFLNLGMTVEQLVERVTVNAARAAAHPELGTLKEGSAADVALIAVDRGKFGFADADHATMTGDRRLRCVLTVRNGAVVWDSEGLAATDVTRAGPYTNFK